MGTIPDPTCDDKDEVTARSRNYISIRFRQEDDREVAKDLAVIESSNPFLSER